MTDTATTALLAQMSVQPDSTFTAQIDALITGLKATAHSSGGGATLWSKLDRFHRFDMHDRQAAHLDWKTPGSKYVLETGSGSPSGSGNATTSPQIGWTADQGFNLATSASTNYLSLGEAPNAWSNVATDNAAFAVDMYATSISVGQGWVQPATNGTVTLGQIGGSSFTCGLNDTAGSGADSFSDATATHWKRVTISRVASGTKKMYQGNTEVASFARNDSGVGASIVRLLYGDGSNIYVAPPITAVMRGFWVGAGMTVADITAINDLIDTFIARSSPTPTPTPSSARRPGGIGLGLRMGLGGGYVGGAPTPSPSPSSSYPAWLLLATIPDRPPTAGGSATITTANFAAQIAAENGSSGVRYCAAGDYTSVFSAVESKNFSSGMLRLAAADPANPPYVRNTGTSGSATTMTGANNVWFDGWRFEMPNYVDYNGNPGNPIVILNNCTNMRFTRGRVTGGVDPTYGLGVGMGFDLIGSDNIQIDRVELYNLAYGIRARYGGATPRICTDVYCGFMDFNRANGAGGLDFFNFYGANKVIIEQCEYWDNKWLADNSGFGGTSQLHPDFCQMAVVNTFNRGTSNLLIRKSIVACTANSLYAGGARNDGSTEGYVQGIVWIADEYTNNDFPNIYIEDCDVLGCLSNGLAHFAGPRNFGIVNNRVIASSRSNWQSKVGTTRIVADVGNPFTTGEIVDTIICTGNVTPSSGIAIATQNAPGNGVTATNVTNSGNTTLAAQDDTYFNNVRTAWEATRTALY
jgi:hypothetical protein